jgi:hypothetical protein
MTPRTCTVAPAAGDGLFSATEVPAARRRRARLVGYTESSVTLPAVVGRTGVPRSVSLSQEVIQLAEQLERCYWWERCQRTPVVHRGQVVAS